jgi:hypothetical protein
MLMFLTILAASLPVLLICCLAAAGLSRQENKPPDVALDPKACLDSPKFFGAVEARRTASRLPIELLLSQIESHVRLEQAAAESFLCGPTLETLHSPSAVNPLN